MNESNLHALIDRYEAGLQTFIEDHEENFKWIAAERFRAVWHSDLCERKGFAEMFKEARRETHTMIDNSHKAPTNGIVRMAELQPERVEQLFREVLFAPDGGNLAIRQHNTDRFLEDIEAMRKELFPAFWKFKHERTDAMAYLAMLAPEQNYLYRYTVTEDFCEYIEFGPDIGFGGYFRLDLYHQLCNLITEALKEHPSLLEKHASYTGANPTDEGNLHIMAFDLMYCTRTYRLHEGLQYAPRKNTGSSKAAALARQQAAADQVKAEKITSLNSRIRALENEVAQFSEISLTGVRVHQKTFGNGIIVRQEMNKIWVDFGNDEKLFTIHRDFVARPTFEDDAEIVDMYTEYGDKSKALAALMRELERLLR